MAAREENITRAASLLHVTQPTLSRQLMQLEEELGVKLFERSSHSIILTDEGMLLKRRAQELLRLAEKTKREVSHEEESIIGEIAIGSGELRSSGCLAELLSSFPGKISHGTSTIFSAAMRTISRTGWSRAFLTWDCCWSLWTSANMSLSVCH